MAVCIAVISKEVFLILINLKSIKIFDKFLIKYCNIVELSSIHEND